ncbi:hypothetical protein XELAEV_18006641mg [Xenopus laevis]|uniref:Uncharacterized protein n=1 Tax=Xenopus laevis TaxID=8355 RepID=A0A974I4D4_XENLA|nr:hypothetical protein XELAEV_18006641mg [Xenopus laevis]
MVSLHSLPHSPSHISISTSHSRQIISPPFLRTAPALPFFLLFCFSSSQHTKLPLPYQFPPLITIPSSTFPYISFPFQSFISKSSSLCPAFPSFPCPRHSASVWMLSA